MQLRALSLVFLVGLLGCQGTSQSVSLYAPFGPAVVPSPNLARANAAPYYSAVGEGNSASPSPASNESKASENAANSAGNKLSHYDPYRGILVPGGYTPTPVALRSNGSETAGTSLVNLQSTLARSSGEEPIRIVEDPPKGLGSAIDTTIAKATEGRRTNGGVQFQASPPSGVVRREDRVPITTNSTSVGEFARQPKTAPSSSDAGTPGRLAPLRLGTPPAATPTSPTTPAVIPAKPAESRRLSLWDGPGDGSRVEPASYSGEVIFTPSSPASGSWRQRSP